MNRQSSIQLVVEYTNTVQNAKVSGQLATACRQRDVVRGLITSIQKQVKECETQAKATDLSGVDRLTLHHLVQKLERSDVSLKEFHLGVLDLIDEVKQDDKQAVLDEHNLMLLVFSNS